MMQKPGQYKDASGDKAKEKLKIVPCRPCILK